MQISKVKTTAEIIRKKFETCTISDTELLKLYVKYNPIPEPKIFLQKAKKLFPDLNCGLASVYLRHVLGVGSVIQGKYGSHGHTFLLLQDIPSIPKEIIVDITADQFGGPPIYIGPLQPPWALREEPAQQP